MSTRSEVTMSQLHLHRELHKHDPHSPYYKLEEPMILGDEFRARRYKNGGMQLATWIVLVCVLLAGFGLGLIWHSF